MLLQAKVWHPPGVDGDLGGGEKFLGLMSLKEMDFSDSLCWGVLLGALEKIIDN